MSDPIDPKAIVRDVLERMPDEFHLGRAPVAARTDLHDALRGRNVSDREMGALFEQLDAALADALGPTALAPLPESHTPATPPKPDTMADPDALRERIAQAIGLAFSTTFDGTRERAEVVAGWARAEVAEVLEKAVVSAAERRALVEEGEQLIRAHMADVMS